MFDLSDLRFLLEIHRWGGIAQAARRIGVNQSTVARRVQALEEAIGSRLVDRLPTGYSLTETGLKLIPYAQEVEDIGLRIESNLSGNDSAVAGVVRIGVPEGFGSCFLAPACVEFHRQYPDLSIDMVSLNKSLNLNSREAEIAICMERPSSEQLVIKKLTDYKLGLYASDEYLGNHGPLKDKGDIADHCFIGYVDDLIVYDRDTHFNIARDPCKRFRSTSVIAQREAAIAGAGIVLLPKFMVKPEHRLQEVLPGVYNTMTLPYWITAQRDMLSIKRVRIVWNFIIDITHKNQGVMMNGA